MRHQYLRGGIVLLVVLHLFCSLMKKSSISEQLSYTRYVWSFYDPVDSPGIPEIQKHTRSILSKRWKYKFLTNSNISSFLNMSSFPKHYHQLSPAHQADYLRLRLAEKYGGWWIDGDMLVTDSRFFEQIYKRMKAERYQLFACCIVCPRKAIENGLFYAPRGSVVIRSWLDEIEREHSMGQVSYHYDVDERGVTTTFVSWENYPNLNPYWSAHVALQYTLERRIPRNTKLLILESGTVHYRLPNDCNWQIECIKNRTIQQFSNGSYPVTKFIHQLRDKIWPGGEHIRWEDREPYTWTPGIRFQSHYLTSLRNARKLLRVAVYLLFFSLAHMFRKPQPYR